MKKHIPFLLILALGVVLRLWWWSYTKYTAEDAYITFQFARSLALHNEFSFNPGQPIYGTTTPLLTILLSTWYAFDTNIVVASKVIALLAFAGGLTFLYLSLKGFAQWVAPLLIAISFRLIAEEMSGMEMSLLFFFMMGALRGLTLKDPWLAGLMCGFLLWTRVDAVVFVGVMVLAHYVDNKPILPFLAGVTLVYLPWVLFSWWYFGSPVPFTIIAKEVAYGINNPPFLVHAKRIWDYLSPAFVLATLVAACFITKRSAFLLIFLVLQAAFLVYTGSTFFPRYFYMLTVVAMIVIAFAAARIREVNPVFPVALLILFLVSNTNNSAYFRSLQAGRHAILTQIGDYLHTSTPPGATIQLEPLGYIGYGAQRVMFDEVGLVTPAVVELHRDGIGAEHFYRFLRTDYILLACHQADGVLKDFSKEYEGIHLFTDLSTRGCYELWSQRE